MWPSSACSSFGYNFSTFQGKEFALGFFWGMIFVVVAIILIVKWIFLDVSYRGKSSSSCLMKRKVIPKISISTTSNSTDSTIQNAKSNDWFIQIVRFAIRSVANKFAVKMDLEKHLPTLPSFISQLEVKNVQLNHATLSIHSIKSHTASSSDSLRIEAVVEWIDAAQAGIEVRFEVGIQEIAIGLPCSLNVGIERFVACVNVEVSPDGRIELCILEEDLVCDLKLSSAIGYKYALCDVPQIHDFIRQKVIETLSGFRYCLLE